MESLKKAVFTTDTFEIELVTAFTDMHPDWADLTTLDDDLVITGASRGGNLEILHWNLAADRWIRPVEDYSGCVLLETSEEMSSAVDVYRMLRNMGERGLLKQFPAIVVAKPKAWDRVVDQPESMRAGFRAAQYAAVHRVVREHHPGAVVVCGPDFGHTDPQRVLPYGGQITVDGPGRRITVAY